MATATKTKARPALAAAAEQHFARPAGIDELASVRTAFIVPGRWQYRRTFDKEALAELAASIVADGLINRPVVFFNEQGAYELIAGERRWRAYELLADAQLGGSGLDYTPADYAHMPVRVVEGTARQLHLMTLVDNLQRENPDVLDEGMAFERLITDLDISEAELSRMTGKNRAYIQQRRALAGAAPEVQEALVENTITFSIARAIAAGAPGEPKTQAKALKIISERISQGRKVTEKDAGEVVDSCVFATVPKRLQALGWSADKGYDGLLVWSAADKPRLWTGREALETVKAKRHPTPRPLIETLGDAETPAINPEALAYLETRYIVEHFNGWYSVQDGYGASKHYMDAAEAADFGFAWGAAIAGVRDRFQAGGWTFEQGGRGYWSGVGPKGGCMYLRDWAAVERLAEAIEEGRAIEPAVDSAKRAPERVCDSCKQLFFRIEYSNGRYLCDVCFTAAEAEIKRQKEALHTAVTKRWGDWMSDVPVDALRLLVTTMTGSAVTDIQNYDSATTRCQKAAKLDEPTMRQVLLDLLFSAAWNNRNDLKLLDLADLQPGGRSKTKEVSA